MLGTIHAERAINSHRLERYQMALKEIRPSGHGYRIAISGAANLGVLAGLDHERIFLHIRQVIATLKKTAEANGPGDQHGQIQY